MVSAATLQTKIYRGYAIAGSKLGPSYSLYRSTGNNPLATAPITSLPAIFTSGKSSGFNFDKSSTYEDLLFAVLADANQLQVGDYLVGSGGTFFIADMPTLRPVVAVLCNGTATLRRPSPQTSPAGGRAIAQPSQPGGAMPYFGANRTPTVAGANGETILQSGIPCALAGTTGRATGIAGLPSEAPGPSRWRIYLPQSAFPKGSVLDRDIIQDDESARYMTSAADWTSIGYRLETIRLEA